MKTSRIRTASLSILVIAAAGGAAYVWRDRLPPALFAALPFGHPAAEAQTSPPGGQPAAADATASGQTHHHHDKTGGQDQGQTTAEAPAQSSGNGNGTGGGHGRNGGTGGPAAVKTVAAVTGVLPLDIPATGFAVADQTTMLTAAEQGVVTDIAVSDGATVKSGDLIARLDDRAARAAVAKDEAMILRDSATLAEAETALRRAQDLVANKAGAQQTLDQAQAARDTAAATVEADKATRAADQVLLEHTEIRAPFDGRLGEIQISLGANLAYGAPVVRLVKFDPVYVSAHMEQALLPWLRSALAKGAVGVTTVPSAKGDVAHTGTLAFFDNTVDPASGTILVKARFDNPDGTLWPGQAVNMVAHINTDDSHVLVPTVAVEPGQQGPIAYVIRDGKADVVPVTVDRVAGDMTAVSAGLSAGDHVVVEGQAQLFPGRPVTESVADGTAADPAKATQTVASEQAP